MPNETDLQSLAWKPAQPFAPGSERRKARSPVRLTLYRTGAEYYDRLMQVLRYAQTRRSILNDFLPTLPSRARILEVGCGTGICTDALRDFYPEAEIRGLDQSPEMLSLFRQRHPTIPTLARDFNHSHLLGSHPLLKPGSYDLVLSAGALSEYGRAEAYSFVSGLLKARGILLNIGIQRNVIGRLIGSIWGFRPSDPGSIMSTCRAVGFSAVSSYRLAWNAFPRTLIDLVIIAEKAANNL